jgi:hypothetical protein
MPVWIISSGYVRSLGLMDEPLMSRNASASTGGLVPRARCAWCVRVVCACGVCVRVWCVCVCGVCVCVCVCVCGVVTRAACVWHAGGRDGPDRTPAARAC